MPRASNSLQIVYNTGSQALMPANSVLFVLPNINGTYADAYSFGLASVAGVAREKGWDYAYAVLKRNEDCDELVARVKAERPRVLAFSSVSSQFAFVRDVSARVRAELADSVVQVCGGVHATISPECVLEAPGLDGIFVGEGELAFRDFLDRVAAGEPFRDVRNFAYARDGRVRKNPLHALIRDLDALPYPERERYGYQRFIDQEGYAAFFFSRGCPYQCTYCSNHAIAAAYGLKANKPRYRSPAGSIEEIQSLRRQGFRFRKVFIDDDTFGVDRAWAEEFCGRYAREITLPLACQLRVNLVDENLMQHLKRAGCVHVSCGVESGNEYIRNTIMRRGLSEKQIVEAYALFRRHEISSNAINLIGLPQETEESLWDTVELNRRINPTSSGVNIFYPYRGTVLGDYCFERGLVDKDEYLGFSKERRESILAFPREFRERLRYFHRNWEYLVYKRHPARLARMLLSREAGRRLPRVWNALKKLKAGLA